jgi:hypothetical protein
VRLHELLTRIRTLRQAEDRWMGDDAFYLPSYADRLNTRRPERVLGVVALPWPRPRSDRWTRLVAFARYRRAYSVIEELADVLAPAVLETGLVPMIVPIRDRDVLGMTAETPFVRRTIERGVVLFDSVTLR